MTNDDTKLLTAVDALTKPRRLHHQAAKNGRHVDHEPLLAQLRAAISATLIPGGGKTLPSHRIPIDPHALTIYTRIDHAIREAFTTTTGQPGTLHPEHVLRAWYVRYTQTNPTPHAVEAWTARIYAWVGEIERLLDPPRTRELVDTPCITCGKADTLDDQGNLVTAVIVEYRRDDDDSMRIEQTLCRACKQAWEGEHGASSFRRYADEQDDHATLYEVEIPDTRLHHGQAVQQARAAFLEAGTIWGRIRLTHAPTPDDPAWRFTTHIRDTPDEQHDMIIA